MDFANRLVSYKVVEWELSRMQEAMTELQAQGKTVPPSVELRLSSLEIRRDMMQVQAEIGQLTPESYLQGLRDAIPREKARSAELKALPGGARRALDAFKHAQMMAAELREAEAEM